MAHFVKSWCEKAMRFKRVGVNVIKKMEVTICTLHLIY